MPRTETYNLRDELERVYSEMKDLADEAAALDEDEPVPSRIETRVSDLERQYLGLAWALNEDEDADKRDRDAYERVTISELTTGAHLSAGAEMEQDIKDSNIAAGADTERLYRVAKAVDDADFLTGDAGFSDTFLKVAGMKPHFFFWLEERVDDLTTPTVEGNGFAALVQERRSTNESQSSTPE